MSNTSCIKRIYTADLVCKICILNSPLGNLNICAGDRINVAAVIKVVELAGNTNARTYSPFWCQTGNPVNSRAYLNSFSGGGYFGTSNITVEEVEL